MINKTIITKLMPCMVFIILCKAPVIAQMGNNWCFGYKAGVNFSASPPKPFSSAIRAGTNPNKTDTLTCLDNQSYSNCKGELLLYIGDGDYIWNKEHKLLPSCNTMANRFNQSVFLPHPADDSTIVLFTSEIYKGFVYYTIDLRLDSGRGDIASGPTVINDTLCSQLLYVKDANDSDYWIIAKFNYYQTKVYKLTKNGVNTKPSVALVKGNGSGATRGFRVSNSGTKIIGPNTLLGGPEHKHYIYDFNKTNGTFSKARTLYYDSGYVDIDYFSFSPNDSIVYGFSQTGGFVYVYQIPTYDTTPYLKMKLAITGYNVNDGNKGCQLGPDNKIYLPRGYDTTHSHRYLSCIPYPDVWGSGCGFVMNAIKLDSGTHWSSMDMPCYSYPIKRINNRFNITGANNCGYDTVRFTADADSAFKSYHWYFGDGDSAVGKSVVHQYKSAGSYYVRLACELGNCGYRQWVGDSVTIKFKPNIALEDSGYYTCGLYHVQTKVLYKYCDTINLHLGNYDTVLYTNNSSSVNTFIYNNTFDTNGTYIYYAAAKNSDCYDSVGLLHTVKFEQHITPSFKPDYFTSCGYSTITLTDSSGGMDSIIQQRKWAIEFPNNFTKQYDTVSSNKLKLNVQDTGLYNAKLIYITKQGCIDSLYKIKVFRILPQPIVYIDTPLHNPLCFKDSFIFTAKQRDTAYPPLVSYKWNMGQVVTKSVKVDTANSYYVAAINSVGCGAQSNTVKISFLPQLFANIKKATDSLYVVTTRPITTYSWYKDSVLYNTTSSLYHPPSGRYYVQVMDANGCMAASGSLLYTTGINYMNKKISEIRAYPNPTNDVLYIEGIPSAKTNIVLYDMLGKNVCNTSTNGEPLYVISIGHLAKGLYILSIGEEKIKLAVE